MTSENVTTTAESNGKISPRDRDIEPARQSDEAAQLRS